ncbi:MAG: phage head spike fiber domain-containing protein [Bryobacteraceae bacterium]
MALTHSLTLSGLEPDTVYHFSARSRDAAGNPGNSPDATFTTSTSQLVTAGLVARYSFTQPADRPVSVNFLEYPNDFANWIIWRNTSATARQTPPQAPDGTMTATNVRLRAPDGLLYHPFLETAPSQTYTFSIYMRTFSGTYDLRLVRDNADCWCGTASPTYTITNQWQRYTLTFTTASFERASSIGFGYEEITPWNLPATGEVLVWGAQLEPGPNRNTFPYRPARSARGRSLGPEQQWLARRLIAACLRREGSHPENRVGLLGRGVPLGPGSQFRGSQSAHRRDLVNAREA